MEIENEKIILTGDRPTGRLHIGHYVGSLRRRVELQKEGDYDEMYVMIADTQALTDHAGNVEKVRENVIQVALDYLSCGLDPEKVTIFVQSRVPALFEITCYFLDLVTLSRLERNPTVKAELQQKNFAESIPVGFLTYPISQAADILTFGTTIVPVGEDQKPMIEQANEIVHKFNSMYGEVFRECKAVVPENQSSKRLPGTDGKAKMSKSVGNCIYLSDDEKTLNKKVMSMFTDPTHLSPSDPGHTDNNTVFIYLDAFATDEHFKEFLPEYKNLEEMKAHYERGGLGDVVCKRFLFNVLNSILKPIRERRYELEKDISKIYEMLERGCQKANDRANVYAARARRAIGINYFENKKFIEKQQKEINKDHKAKEELEAYLTKQKKS